MGDARHAHLGIAHGRRRVAVNGTEVALTIHQHITQGKGLRHAHNGVVNRRVPVRVVLANDVTDNTRRFLVGLVIVIAQLAHGEQRPPVYRFQPIARIGQRTSHNHAHGVIEIGLLHLVLDVDGQDFFREFVHLEGTNRS